jgi:hypothetical protein
LLMLLMLLLLCVLRNLLVMVTVGGLRWAGRIFAEQSQVVAAVFWVRRGPSDGWDSAITVHGGLCTVHIFCWTTFWLSIWVVTLNTLQVLLLLSQTHCFSRRLFLISDNSIWIRQCWLIIYTSWHLVLFDIELNLLLKLSNGFRY